MYCNNLQNPNRNLFLFQYSYASYLYYSNRIWTAVSAKVPENGAKQVEMCWHYRPYSRKILKWHLRTLQVRKALKLRYDFICFNLNVNHTPKHSYWYMDALAIILKTVPWLYKRFRGSVMQLRAQFCRLSEQRGRGDREACLGTSEQIFIES